MGERLDKTIDNYSLSSSLSLRSSLFPIAICRYRIGTSPGSLSTLAFIIESCQLKKKP